MTALMLVVAAVAVHRVSRLIVADTIFDGPRGWLLERWPAADTEFVGDAVQGDEEPHTRHGRPLFYDPTSMTFVPVDPHWFGQLVSCVWCTSFWVAVAVSVGLWAGGIVLPLVGWLLLPFAFSSVAGLLDG